MIKVHSSMLTTYLRNRLRNLDSGVNSFDSFINGIKFSNARITIGYYYSDIANFRPVAIGNGELNGT